VSRRPATASVALPSPPAAADTTAPRPSRESLLRPRKKPVQSRSRVTVDAIIEAAGRLFVRDGYGNTTTNHIAEYAGVSVGSLYEYFPNKGSILAALLKRQIDGMFAEMRARLAEVRGRPLEEVVRAIARAGIAAHYKEIELNRLLIASMTRVAQWRQMEQVSFSVAALMRDALAHLIADPVRLEHAAFTVETVVEGLLHRTILFAHRLPAYPLEEEIAAVLIGYLRPMCRQ
jgi:AcrR family transcriptional regulator